jgi:nitrate reductase molybdenum cofactor assembly chaperone NarJ/NarW
MKLLTRARDRTLQDRLVWQTASLLLSYPDRRWAERLETADRLRAHINGPAADLLAKTAAALYRSDPHQAAIDYVATFDMGRRTTLYLTYWTAGDTRKRGSEMHAFVAAYRGAGVAAPKDEAPDHLPVVLEFAATVDPDAGGRLLNEHRVAIDVLRIALAEAKSAYEPAVDAVCATLTAPTDQHCLRVERLARGGPPTETVGLQPFTLTVPPRREAR